MEYYSAVKENEIIPFAVTWMDLDIVILYSYIYYTHTVWNKSDREEISYDIPYICNSKEMMQMNLQSEKTHRLTE